MASQIPARALIVPHRAAIPQLRPSVPVTWGLDRRYVCGLALKLLDRVSRLRRGVRNPIPGAYAFLLPAPALAAAAAALVLPGLAARAAGGIPRSPAKLLGQRIMVALPGTTADPAVLRRIRAGEVGG